MEEAALALPVASTAVLAEVAAEATTAAAVEAWVVGSVREALASVQAVAEA